ncbi:hypothetical protein [Pseudoduganella sp. OTU4001]|uniref:hypothetical protein n=1 Tax=Pseudoduganella sp. OTU4001 TaxID=3043854 RepID=UPI00313BE654
MKSYLPLLLALALPAHAEPAHDLAQALNANILASSSATLALEKWCAEHAMATPARIQARLLRGSDKPASEEQRARLSVDAETPLKYRRVQLYCGEHLMSEADNWYVPGRLTAAMNQLLEETDTPFGKVVQPLKPYRRTFATRMLMTGDALFEHNAVLYTSENVPIAEVRETYQRGALSFR